MSLVTCFDRAAQMGVLSSEEAAHFKQRIRDLSTEISDSAEVRQRLIKEVEAEAAHRERAALLTEVARVRIEDQLTNYRNLAGEQDKLEAWINMHENYGKGGSFIQDAEGRRETIVREAQAELRQVMRELRRGAIIGDLRRSMNKRASLRMDNFVKELFGENTGDEVAAQMARAWEKVAEKLRLRFNQAGGAIPVLDRWVMSQTHDGLALLEVGQAAWVKYMMEEGVLDLDRTVHPISGLKMTKAELKTALNEVWKTVTTDGWSSQDLMTNKDVTAQKGRGAVYTQHMDHRFLHFKNADAWLAYSKKFGNPDAFSAIMGHVGVMARDIAHMEVFGPNPNAIREHIKTRLIADAAKYRPYKSILAEQKLRLEDLDAQLGNPSPEREGLIQDAAAISGKIQDIYGTREGRKFSRQVQELLTWDHAEATRARTRPDEAPAERPSIAPEGEAIYQQHKDLAQQLDAVVDKIKALHDGEAQANVETLKEIDSVFAEMREPAVVASKVKDKRLKDYVTKRLAVSDNMWMQMRGQEPVDSAFARRMQSTRNYITATSLGSAWFSSLPDPMYGQDTRLRLGMGLAESNAGRILAVVLKDMITMGRREDAIDAMLGLDSAMNVLHRRAKEVRGIDHQFWSAYVADRVLTTGLLSPWTQAGKHLMGLDVMRFMGHIRDHAMADLPESTRTALQGHGIDGPMWEQIRNAPLKGPHLRPNEVMEAAGQLAGERYLQMILRETRYAVPEATVASRSIAASAQAGTIMGEMQRSVMQFKGFGVAVLMLHAGRIAREIGAGNLKSQLPFMGALIITGAFLGAVSMALKDIKDGRDPKRWLDEKTYLNPNLWGAALLQSGGFGIYGDFLFSETNRFGGGLEKTVAGPLIGKAGDLLELGVGLPVRAIKGLGSDKADKLNPGATVMKNVRRAVPGGNHFLISAAMQRVVMDQMQRLIDPEAQKSFNHEVQRYQKEFGQGFYWRPGNTSWDRAPDLGRILSTR